MKMAKKKETQLLICYCRTKKKLPKSTSIGGNKCFCLPYNAKVGKGTHYRDVILN